MPESNNHHEISNSLEINSENLVTSPISESLPTIYLASESPRRHQLLNQIGIRHEILKLPKTDGEDEPQMPGESPQDYVIRTALEKSYKAQQYIKNTGLLVRPILTADTCVMMDGIVFGKPKDHNHASHILSKLSGKMHEVHTVVVLNNNENITQEISKTKVYFRNLGMRDISKYVGSGEAMGKAGAYGIQGLAAIFIEKIEGSYTGVMGLPLYETYKLLKGLLA